MVKNSDPTIKAALLERVLEYLLRNGIGTFSLRPLADATGTNARMLIYHFGSKEQLIIEALRLAQAKQIAMLSSSPKPAPNTKAELRSLWAWFTSERFVPFVKLLFEVEVEAMNGNTLYASFALQMLEGWVAFVRSRLPECDATTANLIVNAFSGLLLDRLVTNDVERTDASLEAFASLIGEEGAS